jgi:hypothetical protein
MTDNYLNYEKGWSSMNMVHVDENLGVVGRFLHPTTMRNIKITKWKIHASPSLFSMPHIKQ